MRPRKVIENYIWLKFEELKVGACKIKTLGTFKDVPQVQLMDGDEIFHGKGIFLDIEQAGSAEVDHGQAIHAAYYFTDPVKLRAGSIIYKITHLDVIVCPLVKGKYHRKAIESI